MSMVHVPYDILQSSKAKWHLRGQLTAVMDWTIKTPGKWTGFVAGVPLVCTKKRKEHEIW